MEKTNVIKISREFKDNVLGGLWLGREISIDDAADPIQAFVKANEELVNAYGRLSGGNGGMDYWNRLAHEQGDKIANGEIPLPHNIPTIQVSKTDKAIEDIAEEISLCNNVASLKTYEKVAKANPKLQEVYNETMNKLP